MTDSENKNPYHPPTSKSDRAKNVQEETILPFAVVRLFVLPFFLAHLVFWPTFFLGLAISSTRDYGMFGLMIGSIALIVSGIIYGSWLAMKIKSESQKNVMLLRVPDLHANQLYVSVASIARRLSSIVHFCVTISQARKAAI